MPLPFWDELLLLDGLGWLEAVLEARFEVELELEALVTFGLLCSLVFPAFLLALGDLVFVAIVILTVPQFLI